MDMPDMRPDQKAKLFFGYKDMIHLFSGCEKKNPVLSVAAMSLFPQKEPRWQKLKKWPLSIETLEDELNLGLEN